MPTEPPHSAEYFGEQRDFWWNAEFLELMAKRWQLGRRQRVLDVGSGIGHWSRCLLPWLPADAEVIGLEREPQWVAEATRRCADEPRVRFVLGDALALPFADASFDLVTCQTVLIHLADPAAALREWSRVLRPGGLLAVAEPNNIAASLTFTSLDFADPPEAHLRRARFQLLCENGKAALGEGHNSVGDLVPGMLAALGLQDVRVYVSDKATPWLPPYTSREQQANLAQLLDWQARGIFGWSRHDRHRFFLAGGGTEAEFESLWAEAQVQQTRLIQGLQAGRASAAGGGLQYLISGQKPPTR
jgi:ubiquinone/menaquinone biosynthesis C-methylase UbiE